MTKQIFCKMARHVKHGLGVFYVDLNFQITRFMLKTLDCIAKIHI